MFFFIGFTLQLILALNFRQTFPTQTGGSRLRYLLLLKICKLKLTPNLDIIKRLDNGINLAMLDFILNLIDMFLELVQFSILDNVIDEIFLLRIELTYRKIA